MSFFVSTTLDIISLGTEVLPGCFPLYESYPGPTKPLPALGLGNMVMLRKLVGTVRTSVHTLMKAVADLDTEVSYLTLSRLCLRDHQHHGFLTKLCHATVCLGELA